MTGGYGAHMSEHVDGAYQAALDAAAERLLGPVPAPRQTQRVRTQLVSRTCGWCGTPIPHSGRSRARRYCDRSCRQRAYEVRTAMRRRAEAEARGELPDATAPVRETVRETVERTTVRTVRVGVPVPTPGSYPPGWPGTEGAAGGAGAGSAPPRAREARARLEQLAAAIRTGAIAHYDHRHILTGVSAVLDALDAAHPGGLGALRRR